MRFASPRRKTRADSIVPMINVVFLLLIFFLMSAELAPAPPFAVDLPEASATDPAAQGAALHAGPAGDLAFGALRGEAALAAAAAAGDVTLRADRALPGGDLARLLARLAALGATGVQLVVEGG